MWIPGDLPVKDRKYLAVFIRADQVERIFKLEAYDILSFLGDLGGLLDITLLFGSFLSSALAFRIF